MDRTAFVANLKRAAKQNPIWAVAKLYTVSGKTAEGELQFALAEETYGFLDLTRADEPFTVGEVYAGDTRLTVLCETSPLDVELIQIGSVFYVTHEVLKSDALRAQITFRATATDETPPII